MAKSRPLTADQWHAATDPAALLRHLRHHKNLYRAGGHRRKLRLLGCAAARAVWDSLPDGVRAVVAAAERHADTELRRTALRATRESAARRPESLIGVLGDTVQTVLAAFGLSSPDWNRQHEARELAEAVAAAQVGPRRALLALRAAARLAVAAAGERVNEPVLRAAWAGQCRLARDLFGDPFAPAEFDPRWRTTAVAGLARAAHADGAFDRLPILADALEEAGCADPAILAHCRDGGAHARGCWVVDGVLGRGVRWK